jgi:hypothetical protein
MSAEEMKIFTVRQRITGAWEAIDSVILTISFVGFLLLLIFLLTGYCKVSLKTKALYISLLAAVLLAIPILFGLTDPIYKIIDYTITPILVIGRIIIFLLADFIIGFIKRRLKNKK